MGAIQAIDAFMNDGRDDAHHFACHGLDLVLNPSCIAVAQLAALIYADPEVRMCCSA